MKAMKSIEKIAMTIAVIILSTSSVFAARQDAAQLKGRVLDATTGDPLRWATVAVMAADSSLVGGIACDENGNYTLSLTPGSYTLNASLLGYVDQNRYVEAKPGITEVPDFRLETDARMISGATVTGKVALVEMKVDKLVMNVSQSAFAQGSNALDLIRKAPGVTVDKDGNVKLNGKSVSIWIDGRPSYVDGKSLESLLRSTNGESIDKFEIMEHPSAKYDASGQGGIINIKTRKNLLAGLNGSLGLGGGGMYFAEPDLAPWQQTAWLNLGYRTKKTNTFISIYEGFYNNHMQLRNDLTMPENDFHQLGNTTLLNFYHNYNVKLGNDWFIDDRNTFGVILYVPGEYSTTDSDASTTEQWLGGEKVMTMNSVIGNLQKSTQYTANLNYTHIFDESRSAEITTNLDWYRSNGSDHNTQEDEIFYVGQDRSVPGSKLIDSGRIYDIYSAKADYQTVIAGRYMLEAGAKWALSVTDNNTLEQQTGIPENDITFRYREHVGAGYVSMSAQFGKKFSAKLGLRGEYTDSFGDWISAGDCTRRHYFDLFPTAYVGFTPNEKLRLSLSYSRRIDRPGYSRLNPAKTYIDSRTYLVGNPDILPQYSDDLSFMVGLGQHLSLAVGYNNTANAISQIPSYTSDGTQYLTWGNFGRNSIGYASFSVASLPITGWFNWTFTANALYIDSQSSLYDLSSSQLGAQSYMAFSFILPKDWKIELDGNASTAMRMANYHIHPTFVSNLAVKKTMLDNRLTLSFSLDDIFRTSTNDIDMEDGSGTGTMSKIGQKYYNQKFLVDLTWSFGKASSTRHRKVGNLEEMSRASGGNGLGK